MIDKLHKARLVNARATTDRGERVVFDVSVDISEARSPQYTNIAPIHMPGEVLAYARTPSRSFSLSGIKLISDTQGMADINIRLAQKLREWCMPNFGRGGPINSKNLQTQYVRSESERTKMNQTDSKAVLPGTFQNNGVPLGAPPPVLLFSAYSDSTGGKLQNIYKIPTVIEGLTISYPSDCDYILTTNGVPFPIIMSIDLQLKETHSVNEIEQFNLTQYKQGTLAGF